MDAAKNLNSLNNSLKEIRDESGRVVSALADRATDTAQRASAGVDRAAHRYPWYFIGAVAVVAGAIGFASGRRTK